MSILIKGIEMPEDIDELRLIVNGMSIAIETDSAIQIPTTHGRLIDKDELMKWLEIPEECKDCKSNYYGFCSKGSDFVNACEAITTECPTIIEAEGR